MICLIHPPLSLSLSTELTKGVGGNDDNSAAFGEIKKDAGVF